MSVHFSLHACTHPAENNLSILKRKPSDLHRYIIWTNGIKATYGSITHFVCQERLHWEPLPSSSSSASSDTPAPGPIFTCENDRPFASRKDYKILLNDWPYGISPNITHIVVWLKTPIPVQQPDGYLTSESAEVIQKFVQETFVDPLVRIGQGKNQVQWFKNWVGLQSVRGLDHFHVLVRDAPRELLDQWIEGGVLEVR